MRKNKEEIKENKTNQLETNFMKFKVYEKV
jgi:hypothetical protein